MALTDFVIIKQNKNKYEANPDDPKDAREHGTRHARRS